MSNTARLNIAIEVDDRGSVKIRQLGRTVDETGKKGEKSFRRMGRTLGEFRDRAARTVKTLALFGSATILGGLYALNRAMTSFVALANDQEEAENRLQGVLRATGHAAGFNLAQLKEMASAMQSVTTVGDEVILSGMSILATFKNVRGEAFERTTRVALDMARVMGTDLNSAMLQIGKAMNDPAKNLSMLSRAGVTFTQTQIDMVKQMVATGDTMGAQEIILRELESEFGGAAEMARGNFKGAMVAADNALGDLKEEIGFTVTKNREFIDVAGQFENIFNHWIEAVRRGRETTGELDSSLDDLLQRLDRVGQEFFEKLPGRINATIGAMGEVIDEIDQLKDHTTGVINAVPRFIWEVGLVAALFGGKKGKIALGIITGLAEVKKFLDDLELFYSSEGVQQMLALQRDMLTVHDGMGASVGDLGPKLITMAESAKTATTFVGALAEETGAAMRVTEDFDGQVDGWTSDYDDLALAYRDLGDAAGESAKDACEAGKKTRKCLGYTRQQLQEYAIEGKMLGKDMWLSFAEGAEAASERAQQAQDAINEDLEVLMEEHKELWEGGNDQVVQLQEQLVNDMGRIMDGYIYDILPIDLSAIKDQFGGLFAAIVDMFMRMVSQIAANSLVDVIFGTGASGGLTIQGLLGGGSLLSTATSGASLATGASTVAGWLGIGGQTTIAPYVAGAGVPLGSMAAAGGAGAAGAAALADFSIDAAGGYAASAGIGSSAPAGWLATAGPIGMGLVAGGLMLMGTGLFGHKKTPRWAFDVPSGGQALPVQATGDPGTDLVLDIGALGDMFHDAAMKSGELEHQLAGVVGSSEESSERLEEMRGKMDFAIKMAAKDLEAAAYTFGDTWAQMALDIDGSVESIDRFVDASAGYDVALSDSMSMFDLATEAARGNSESFSILEQQFIALGLAGDAAQSATMAMVIAADRLSQSRIDLEATARLNVEVSGAASDHASVSSSISTHGLYPAHPDIFGTREDTGWGPNVTEYSPHAVGGIFTRPTLLAGRDGIHLVAEAGVPELITPIPGGPQAFSRMAAGIEELLSRQGDTRPIIIHVDIAGSRVGEVLIPMVDRHIAARESRGVKGRVAYAAG